MYKTSARTSVYTPVCDHLAVCLMWGREFSYVMPGVYHVRGQCQENYFFRISFSTKISESTNPKSAMYSLIRETPSGMLLPCPKLPGGCQIYRFESGVSFSLTIWKLYRLGSISERLFG